MLCSAEIERAREARYQEPNADDETPPEGPCLVGRDKSGEPLFAVWRLVDGEWTQGTAFADELTPDEVAMLSASDRSVALWWRDRIAAAADERDPESAIHNAEPRSETVMECRDEAYTEIAAELRRLAGTLASQRATAKSAMPAWVTTAPFPFDNGDARAFVAACASTYDPREAKHLCQRVGMNTGYVSFEGSGYAVWRDVWDKAAAQNKAASLYCLIVADDSRCGIFARWRA